LGGPKWIESELYRIVAKPPEGPAPDKEHLNVEINERIRSLLADRFQMQVHREMREHTIYSLVIAKGGSKLKEVSQDPTFRLRLGKGRMSAHGGKIDMLATLLSNHFNCPVENKTGLTAFYDIQLEYAADDNVPDTLPSLFAALQEQLGLKLEAHKGPVEFLVIYRIERPTEN
jgi:uncharacterized protein (TIGR03435 family)